MVLRGIIPQTRLPFEYDKQSIHLVVEAKGDIGDLGDVPWGLLWEPGTRSLIFTGLHIWEVTGEPPHFKVPNIPQVHLGQVTGGRPAVMP